MKKICVFTGTRAEYGLLKPLMDEIKKDKALKLKVIASGMHLSAEFGLTFREIEKDGFSIDKKVEMLLSSDTSLGILKSTRIGIIGISKALNQIKPDITIILGDRFEALACAIASAVLRIPNAHIHGGELSEGVYDDAFRHSITKMSHLHFTSTEEYKRRVVQLGEDPGRVFNVGALGIDNIKNLKLLSKKEIEKENGFKFNKRNLLVTFHPVTLEKNSSKEQVQNLLKVLDELKDTNIIFTKANADIDGRIINKMIDEYVANNRQKAGAFVSMGQLKYLSTMKHVDAVVGNSSSGIIESPSFKIGVINIGDRQRGRIKAENIIDCRPEKESIRKAFRKLYSSEFKRILQNVANPYGNGGSAKKILKVLKTYDLNNILKKSFFDIDFVL